MSSVYIGSLARHSWNDLARLRFHRRHAREARAIVRTLERARGRPGAAQLRLADDYAHEIFGDLCYAPWLRAYTTLNGTFREGWIPDNYYGWVVVPKLKGSYGRISDLKSISKLIFQDDAFPDLGYYVNGIFFSADHAVVPESEIKRLMFRDTDRLAFKLDKSSQGKGVFFLDRKRFDVGEIRQLGNGVFQRYIMQHEAFDQFRSKAVATIRFTTVVEDDGRISLRACFLRLGRATDTHVRPQSEVCIPVDMSSGQLLPQGYLGNWLDVDAHPDSKVRFENVTLPAFRSSVAKVLELHAKIRFTRCVGWDLTVDADGTVRVMEWNAEHNDVKFSEATQGPCFSDLNWEALQRPVASC